MTVRITGKGLDIGEALSARISERLEAAADKYFDRGYSALVVVEKQRSSFDVECLVHLDSGIDITARGTAADGYGAFEKAAEHLEKRLRRYKRRLKSHRSRDSGPSYPAVDYVLAAEEEGPGGEDMQPEEDNPIIVAETKRPVRTLSVADAVMALDLGSSPVVMFRHAGSGRLNAVYRRADGNVGWLDPDASGEPGSIA